MFNWLQSLFRIPQKKLPEKIFLAGGEAVAIPSSGKICVISWEQREAINTRFYNWMFDIGNRFSSGVSPAERKVLESLDEIIRSKQSASDLVKRMPGVVPELMQILRTGNFSGTEVSRKILHDIVLVQAVLRAANSALYNTDQAITSIEHAVLIIGQEGLRQLIASVAFRPIINLQSGRYVRQVAPIIWSQSEQCAVANRTLAPDYGIDPFESFLAGLTQNMGLMALLSIADKIAAGNESFGSSSFCAALLRHARDLTCAIGREWRFPDAVVQAIEEQKNSYKQSLSPSLSPLGRVLFSGDYLSKVSLLAKNGQIKEDDPVIWEGLSDTAANCYQELKGFEEQKLISE